MTEILTTDFEVKSVNDTGVFEGYASVFTEVDDGRDAVMPGAFHRSIMERGTKGIKLLWQHDPREPIGRLEEIYEDAKGLFVRGRLLLDIQRAKEALSLLRTGALDGLSIGYKTIHARRDEKRGIRLLDDLDLWEVSLVTFPMQTSARIQSFKNQDISTIRAFETFLRDAGGFSRTEAKALAAHGFEGLSRQRDADGDWAGALGAIQSLKTIIQNYERNIHDKS